MRWGKSPVTSKEGCVIRDVGFLVIVIRVVSIRDWQSALEIVAFANEYVYMKLKERLEKGAITIGSWITLPNPGIAEIFAKAGFDWLVVDLEHSTISMQQAGELIRTIDLAGVPPLVRLTSNNPDQIKVVLDAGAHGVIAPMVNTKLDAQKLVAATRYAPEGVRGVGLARAQGYGATFDEYINWQKTSLISIVQIEHVDALDNLEEILTVPGIDGFIIGPYDLSCSMGKPGDFEDAEFKKNVDFILNVGLKLKKPSGIHIVEPDEVALRERIAQEFNFIAYSVDIRMLDTAARSGVLTAKEAMK